MGSAADGPNNGRCTLPAVTLLWLHFATVPHFVHPQQQKPTCSCCMVLQFGGQCDQTACCCPPHSSCAVVGAATPPPPPNPKAAVCPLGRSPCDMASKTFSSAVCTTGNAACQGCTKDHLPGGSKVSGRRCLYLPPQNGDSAPQLGGVAVTPSAGGLSACSPRYYDVGACNAAKNGRAVAISCASVVAASADKASLSGGEGKLCCADNDHAGFMPGCKAGSAQVVQFNVGAPKPGTCMPGCKPGYRLLGGQNVTKCENGVLSQAVCVPNGCTAAQVRIPPMLGGIGSCNGAMAHGQTCMPACLGKTIVTGTSVCLAGKFISATCEASCGVPPVPGNATAGNCIAVLGPSKTCKPRCNPGFTLIPSGGTSCSSSARLSLARCKAQPCDTSRATPANGRPGSCCSLRGCEIPSGAVCMPECERGYALERPTRCVAGTLTQPVSRCLPSPCNMSGIPPPRNGTWGDCPAVLASGARCLPSCDVGFSLAPRAGTACRTGTLSRAR
jgi:hypothetical protein